MLQRIKQVLGHFRLCGSPAFPIAPLYNLMWYASGQKKRPTVSLETLFPGITGLAIQLPFAIPKLSGNLTVEELSVVALIRQWLQPQTLFEFGTYNGRTTLNLAVNAPADARVFTLDDTIKALAMVHPGGVILWHDYRIWYPGGLGPSP